MSDIVMKSSENECNDIGNKWERKCPDCGRPKTYQYKSRLLEAIRANKRCRSCASKYKYGVLHETDPQAELVNGIRKFFRVCPQCQKKIYYTSPSHRNQMERLEQVCRKCFFENRTIWKHPVSRTCPNCGDTWTITTLAGYKHAIKNNTVCSGCVNLLYPKMSDETIRKIRLTSIKNLQIKVFLGGQVTPGYNINACRYFDGLNTSNGWNLIHALNGGEVFLPTLGYWLDAYDKSKNVVVEWYEKFHFRKGKMRVKDIRRKNEIKQLLKCRFIGYDWNGTKIIDEC